MQFTLAQCRMLDIEAIKSQRHLGAILVLWKSFLIYFQRPTGEIPSKILVEDVILRVRIIPVTSAAASIRMNRILARIKTRVTSGPIAPTEANSVLFSREGRTKNPA